MPQQSPRQHYNTQFGNMGERWALEEFQRLGYDVAVYGGSKKFDLLVGRRMRVEVKASTRGKTRRHTTRWQCRLSRHAAKFNADLLLLLCFNGSKIPIGAFVIPGSKIRPDLTGISISSPDPADYKGQWAKYWNAWEQVAVVLSGIAGLYDGEKEIEIPF